ncbi:MAG: protein-export rane protein SecD, partial [Deltaproteobacteria bacterium]|nr:protein-export rane protein SecD [Deltaproteobacteria bacterium]
MTDPVKHRRVAAVAGILAALYVVVSFLAREVPDAVLALVGGPDGGVDRHGGLRVDYRSPAGEVHALEYPGIAEDQVAEVIDVLVHGGLSMREALESDFAARLGFELPARGEFDPAAVQLEADQWRPEDGGAIHTVFYLRGPSREALEAALAERNALGAALPAGSEHGYERLDPYQPDEQTFWRTYELGAEVLVDGSMIADAVKTYDPNTNRAIILLDFTREGAERFCAITKRLVGKKVATLLGGRVRSAPIINGPICGGRASITMGGSDPSEQEKEAEALVSVLRQGARPIGGTIDRQSFHAPADVTGSEWLARAALGLVAGLLVGLLTLAMLGFARPHWRPAPEPAGADRPFPWRRLAVTLLAPVALIIGGNIMMPGVNDIELMHILHRDPGEQFSVIAIGVMPIISTFVIVELIALAVPRLRWRRHDVHGRIGLGKAVAVLSVVVALVQAYFIVSYLESLSRGGAEILLNPGIKTRIVIMGSLVTATLLLAVVAGLVREHGLGNGYGVLLLAGSVLAVGGPIIDDPLGIALTRSSVDLLALATAVVIVAATACVLRWRITGAAREPDLRVPTSGVSPVTEAGGLMVILVTLSALGLGVALFDVYSYVLEVRSRLWVTIALLVVAVPACAWLFARPGVIERVAMQAGLDRPSRTAWLRGVAVSGWLLIGVALAARFAIVQDGLQQTLVNAVALMVGTAVVLDIVADARAHRRALVPAGVLHQVQYAGV